jgi:hypothetical protein
MKALGKHASGLRLERMKASPRWHDGGFQNLAPIPAGLRSGAMPSIGDFLCGGNRRTPSAPLPARDPREAWTRASETGLRATWLGHSTVLVELDGIRVLTDPVWGERASPMSFAGPKRFQPVPVAVAELPALDVVVISHDHYDHLDYPTLLELAQLDVPFVTSLGVGAHLESWGIAVERITELDWWDRSRFRAASSRSRRRRRSIFLGAGRARATPRRGLLSVCERVTIRSFSAATPASRRSTRSFVRRWDPSSS